MTSIMQFDECSDDYRCCCDCIHVKTATIAVGCVELTFLFIFLLNSLVILADVVAVKPIGVQVDVVNDLSMTFDTSSSSEYLLNSPRSEVITPLIFSAVWLTIGVVIVLTMFLAIVRRNPYMLLPHIVVQIIAVTSLIFVLACSLTALTTDRTVFYRILNATPFVAAPAENTVELGNKEALWVYVTVGLYGLLLLLELWFLFVLKRCYSYLTERRHYMNYCLAYSTPMRTVHVRVPQWGTR